MGANAHNTSVEKKPVTKHDGAKVHIVAFFLSIVLTLLAFIAVAYEAVPRKFVVPFIIMLGIVQAAFQFYVWMHAKDRGHEFPKIAVYGGVVVIIPVVLVFTLVIGK
jgi:cytochrome c oxidase subunit 4